MSIYICDHESMTPCCRLTPVQFCLLYTGVYCRFRQRIHNTLLVVDRYLWLTGDQMIPDSREPHLELFYLPFITGIDLSHQGVVDSYNL